MKRLITWKINGVTYSEVYKLIDSETILGGLTASGEIVATTLDEMCAQWPNLVFFEDEDQHVFGLQAHLIKSIDPVEDE